MIKIARVTINDIAHRLNVSANTVSKALNGKKKISEQLRAEIIKTAEEMGYKKNINASRLSQKPIKIGVLINEFDKNYSRYTVKGLKSAADFLADRRVELSVRVVPSEVDNFEAFKILKDFLNDGFDGVIINDLSSADMLPILEKYREADIKYALLNYDFPETKREFAVVNDYSCAAGLAAEILSISTDKNKFLAVYTFPGASFTQKELTNRFCEKAKSLGHSNIFVTDDIEELFSDENTERVTGIYVSHASYLEVCRKAEKEWKGSEIPKIVVSDLYDECVPYLENGTVTAVIYQEPEQQAFLAVVSLYEFISERKNPEDILSINPLVIMKSNYKKYL